MTNYKKHILILVYNAEKRCSMIFLNLAVVIVILYSIFSIFLRLDPRLIEYKMKYENKVWKISIAIPVLILSLFLLLYILLPIQSDSSNAQPTMNQAPQEIYDFTSSKKEDVNSLLKKFKCDLENIPNLSKDYKNSFEYISMQNDIDKVNLWVKNYKNGISDFDIPIEDVVAKQLELFESSCEYLGGKLSVLSH